MPVNTLAGITPAKFFSPFYSGARARFRLSAREVDELLSMEAHAEIQGHDLKFTRTCSSACTGTISTHRFKIRVRQAARWANEFNDRVAARKRHPSGAHMMDTIDPQALGVSPEYLPPRTFEL